MCMVDDGDRAEFYSARYQRARAEYKCVECRRQITIGERYRYAVSKYEGQIDIYRTCAHCAIAEDWLGVHCHGWIFGEIEEDLAQHVTTRWSIDEEREIVVPSVPARLVVGIRRKWRAFHTDTLMEVRA